VTITTVGFGDLVPYCFIGRIIIMVTSFWGAFIISLVIVSVSKIFELSRNQKKAMHHLFLTRKAASSITSAMRYFMAKKRAKRTEQTTSDLQGAVQVTPIVNNRKYANNMSMDLEEELMINERVEA
jgi:ABC-type Fe3+-siderophore transport system permease subunit